MTNAILSGFEKDMLSVSKVATRRKGNREELSKNFGIQTYEKLPMITAEDVLILAVKPQDISNACSDVIIDNGIVISLAAGVSVQSLKEMLPGARCIVRAMPNIASAVKEGATGLYGEAILIDSDKNFIERIFSQLGYTLWVREEELMHVITGISGSGVAYVFYLMNALKKAAINFGFDETNADNLSLATFKGAIALAEKSDLNFVELQEKVTSKGGTTYEAIKSFDNAKLEKVISQGVEACVSKSKSMTTKLINES